MPIHKVKLDITDQNEINFHRQLPMIWVDEPFQFEVENWEGDIERLRFSDFRRNSTNLDPYPVLDPTGADYEQPPIEFEQVACGANKAWTIVKGDEKKGPWVSDEIRLRKPMWKAPRNLVDYTLTLGLKDGAQVSVDPPLDERRKG